MNLRVTISIDDVNPQKGWRILGEQTEKYLKSLHEEFGCKYTLFVPSCYHGKFPLSEHKEWVKELASIDWIELAAHGHFHQTSDPKRFGECEFFEIKTMDKSLDRIKKIYDEWNSCDLGFEKLGWKNPGWLCSEAARHGIERNVKYASLHYEHNQGMKWSCKEFFGHDGIQQENISIHNGDMIMFTSHIAGSWNHNVWNDDNYEQLRLSLEHITKQYDCQFKTLKECL